MEDAHHLVRSRKGRAFLVAVVEAVELRRQDPDGQRQRKDHGLDGDSDLVDDSAAPEQKLGDDERGDQADHIRGDEQAANEPAAAAPHLVDVVSAFARAARFRVRRARLRRCRCGRAARGHGHGPRQ